MGAADQLRRKFVAGELNLSEYYELLYSKLRVANSDLNCFTSLTTDLAQRTLEILEKKAASGQTGGKLFGVPIVVKDNICVAGAATSCSSKILTQFVPPYNATVVDRLLAEDAVIVAKSNMDEFGMGSSNENSAQGAVHNPHDRSRAPGGSSGGSAAAVAAGLVPAALGSDTGGSIRQPSAFCGVVGLKPTYGSVSRYGLVAFASSLDQIGPLAADVETAELVNDVISAHDPRDSTSIPENRRPATDASGNLAGLRVGIPREYFEHDIQPEIANAIDSVKKAFESAGAKLVDVSLPNSRHAIATYYTIADAEASSNLARFDGVKYGHRAKDVRDLAELYTATRSEGFGTEVKRRIMLGTYVLSSGYYEAYYRKALQVRSLITADFEKAFRKVDIILSPTTPTTAFRLGEKLKDPLSMYLSDIFTVSVNLAGLPAVSVPYGKDNGGLPIGVQLIGRRFAEKQLLTVAREIEKEHHG